MKNNFEQALLSYNIPYTNKLITHCRFTRWGKGYRYYAKAINDGYIFGDFKEDVRATWFPNRNKDSKLSNSEIKYLNRKLNYDRLKQLKKQKLLYQAAAIEAREIWNNSKVITSKQNNSYLLRKKINPYGARIYKDSIVVPMMDISGSICSLQFIATDGRKRFLKGGKTQGSFNLLGSINQDENQPIIICEGFATAATLYEINNTPTICSFSAGNIEHVVKVFREEYPIKAIIIAADNDQYGDKNIGLELAVEAATKYNCKVIYPEFNLDKKGEYNHAE